MLILDIAVPKYANVAKATSTKVLVVEVFTQLTTNSIAGSLTVGRRQPGKVLGRLLPKNSTKEFLVRLWYRTTSFDVRTLPLNNFIDPL
ncbi:hypothetical protein SAMN04487821_1501 [Enterococcus malodoratus]|uniref:hypothetical protein n=1 Tax=Enterococcus malodoratus TaxID=71451 RepID=UPI0008BC2DDE|nr:hypothetical protein [Enterococcus malodoratus]SEU01934.1 hypothetical protein SAMN04487821_1501 [Enterococcus malodoratus]